LAATDEDGEFLVSFELIVSLIEELVFDMPVSMVVVF
jgi:hypothetical protein